MGRANWPPANFCRRTNPAGEAARRHEGPLLLSEIAHRLHGTNLVATAPLSPPGLLCLTGSSKAIVPLTSAFGSETIRPTTAVLILIALNIAMFVAEPALGGSTNPLTLHRLGALESWAVRFGGEYWRLLTSLFLHYGPLHLLFNLYALFVIGPGLERDHWVDSVCALIICSPVWARARAFSCCTFLSCPERSNSSVRQVV